MIILLKMAGVKWKGFFDLTNLAALRTIIILNVTYFFLCLFLQSTDPENIEPSLSASLEPFHNLPTIDIETFSMLSDEVDAVTPQVVTPQVDTVRKQVDKVTSQLVTVTPQVDTVTPQIETVTPQVDTVTPQVDTAMPQVEAVTFQVDTVTPQVDTITPQADEVTRQATPTEVPTIEVPVGEEVIRTCVTPRRVHNVQVALQKEVNRHRCAVRLLPYFFSKEELSTSNTDGTHDKQCLDSNKLNSIKVFFSKFPVECAGERDRL